MAISVTKGYNTLLLTIVKELDREDVYNLHSELGKWLEETATPSGITFHNKGHQEAFELSQKKRLMEESMKEYIASIKPTQHIQKEVQTIELDALNREVEITTTKLKQNGRK